MNKCIGYKTLVQILLAGMLYIIAYQSNSSIFPLLIIYYFLYTYDFRLEYFIKLLLHKHFGISYKKIYKYTLLYKYKNVDVIDSETLVEFIKFLDSKRNMQILSKISHMLLMSVYTFVAVSSLLSNINNMYILLIVLISILDTLINNSYSKLLKYEMIYKYNRKTKDTNILRESYRILEDDDYCAILEYNTLVIISGDDEIWELPI